MGTSHWAVLVGALALAGCKGGDHGARPADSAGMAMPAMQMTSGMQAHMDSMARLSPEQMRARMAGHQEMMSRMMDGMGADMRGMNVPGSPEWIALTDSVKQDLAELPGLKDQALSARMQGHADRVRRLISAPWFRLAARHRVAGAS